MTNKDITAVILTGGRSSRIGRNKAFLTIGDKPFISILIERMQKIFGRVLISAKKTREYARFSSSSVRTVRDKSQTFSSLVGIYSALKASRTKYIFVVAVDIPLVEEELIKRLTKNYRDYDVVIPKTREGLEPLCAIYSKKCLKYISRQLRAGNHKIIDFFDRVRVRQVQLNRRKLFNINTMKDYLLAVTPTCLR